MNFQPHLAVNLLSIVPGRIGGAEEYAVRTLLAFAEHGPSDIRPTLYTVNSFEQAHPELVNYFEVVSCPIDGTVRSRRVLAESTWLMNKTKSALAVHHLGGRLPIRTNKPSCVTIHDLQPLDYPANFSSIKAAYLSWAIPRSIRRADVVVAVSDHVAERIRTGFPIDPEKVLTVSSGVQEIAKQPAKPNTTPVILYPAATYPHKNHLVLIRAFEEIADRHPDVQLILTGVAGRSESEVARAIEESRHVDRIERTGRVSSAMMKKIVETATVLAFPSSYEGFGLPVLEAMAAGVPVVVSSGTPAAEIINQPNLTVSPEDVQGWVSALERVILDEQQRNEAASHGLIRAEKYRWENSAEQLERAWRQLLSRKNK